VERSASNLISIDITENAITLWLADIVTKAAATKPIRHTVISLAVVASQISEITRNSEKIPGYRSWC